MYEYSCQVTRVVDGDTIDADLDLGFNIHHKCRVRLYGIDTPESRTRDKDEKARGKLAAKFLQDAISNGKHVLKDPLHTCNPSANYSPPFIFIPRIQSALRRYQSIRFNLCATSASPGYKEQTELHR